MADVLDLEIQNEEIAMDEGEDEGSVQKLKDRVKRRRGRGFTTDTSRGQENLGAYDTIEYDENSDVMAQRSVEGWILMVTGINEEAHEDDVHSRFLDFGEIKSLHLNLDRRSGFLKGYALVEYENFKEANSAKQALDGMELLGSKIRVDWAFMKKPLPKQRRRN